MAFHNKRSATARLAKASHREKLHPGARLEQLLWDARQEFLSSGETPLGWDDLEWEIAGRRGPGQVCRHL
jgi:hypothetical protein